MHQKLSLRDAVARIRGGINKRTLARRVNSVRYGKPKQKVGRRPALSCAEEQEIAHLCLQSASRGKPLSKEDLVSFVQEKFGHSHSHVFKNGRPGADWLKGFCKRNNLSFSKPNRQAAERFASTNAEVLTTHLATLELVNDKRSGSTSRTRSLTNISFRKGFVDTRHGKLLTSEEAMAAVQQKEMMGYRAKVAKDAREAEVSLRRQKRYEKTRKARIAAVEWAMRRRAVLFNLDLGKLKTPRSIQGRRAVANSREAKKIRMRAGGSA